VSNAAALEAEMAMLLQALARMKEAKAGMNEDGGASW
jgi:hypothetical protein